MYLEMVCSSSQGCGPTVIRAMVVNAAQLATYSQAKQMLLGTGEGKGRGLFNDHMIL